MSETSRESETRIHLRDKSWHDITVEKCLVEIAVSLGMIADTLGRIEQRMKNEQMEVQTGRADQNNQ